MSTEQIIGGATSDDMKEAKTSVPASMSLHKQNNQAARSGSVEQHKSTIGESNGRDGRDGRDGGVKHVSLTVKIELRL